MTSLTSQVTHFRVVTSSVVGYLFLRTFKYVEEDFSFNLQVFGSSLKFDISAILITKLWHNQRLKD
jgi:hypothetical protein